MKLFYSIGEISKLYDISVDILRHYDKIGLLKPVLKKSNGYRYYSSEQIWTINNIRSLRNLGISLDNIKKFLQERDIKATRNIIDYQLQVVNNNLQEILKLKNLLLLKQEKLNYFEKEIQFNNPVLKEIPKRNILRIKGKVQNEGDIDFKLKCLSKESFCENNFMFINNDRGVTLKKEDFLMENYNTYSDAFIIQDKFNAETLAQGLFIVLFFKGDYSQIYRSYNIIKEYIKLNNLEITGDILEFFHIDIHNTSLPNEYITEIQVPVKELKVEILLKKS